MKALEEDKKMSNTAFKQDDGLNYEKAVILKVDDKGYPTKRVNAIAYEKDIKAFWLMHEKEVWIILVICCFYFLSVVL